MAQPVGLDWRRTFGAEWIDVEQQIPAGMTNQKAIAEAEADSFRKLRVFTNGEIHESLIGSVVFDSLRRAVYFDSISIVPSNAGVQGIDRAFTGCDGKSINPARKHTSGAKAH